MGYFYGDGCATRNGKKVSIRLFGVESDRLRVSEASNILGLGGSFRRFNEKVWVRHILVRDHHILAIPEVGLRSGLTRRIQREWFEGRESITKAFLEGLWDADGSVTFGKDRRGYVRFAARIGLANSGLIDDVEWVLSTLGVEVRRDFYTRKGGGEVHSLSVTGYNYMKLWRAVRLQPQKQESLERIVTHLGFV